MCRHTINSNAAVSPLLICQGGTGWVLEGGLTSVQAHIFPLQYFCSLHFLFAGQGGFRISSGSNTHFPSARVSTFCGNSMRMFETVMLQSLGRRFIQWDTGDWILADSLRNYFNFAHFGNFGFNEIAYHSCGIGNSMSTMNARTTVIDVTFHFVTKLRSILGIPLQIKGEIGPHFIFGHFCAHSLD